MLVTACSLPPAPGSITVGDHQSTQSPIQHHLAQLSAQTQLSSSSLRPGSNLPPPADVPCAGCDHLPSVPTQEPQRPWLPFKALLVAANNHRPPAEESLSGIPQGAGNSHPSGTGSSKERAKLSLPHPSALGAQDGRHTAPLCSALRFHRLFCSSTTCCTHAPCSHPHHFPPSFLPSIATGSLQLPPVQHGHFHIALRPQ